MHGKNQESCGCFNSCRGKHGLSHSILYSRWDGINQRCKNHKNSHYKWYGGKGISICKEWRDFENFYNWATENGYEEGLHIDRINSDGNYEPSNCQFIPPKENIRRSGVTKLKKDDVLRIKDLCSNKKLKQKEVAKMYRVSQVSISDIIRGRTWSDV